MRPRLLDLFCGAGGAAMGYHRAGFDVVGVDIKPQPRFPFAFRQYDAMDFLEYLGHTFDVIHASPPCQGNLRSLNAANAALGRTNEHVDLIPQTRDWLRAIGRPYVIENIVGASLLAPVRMCGSSFGLPTYRHRLFESNVLLMVPDCEHDRMTEAKYWTSWRVNGESRRAKAVQVYGNGGEREHWGPALGIDWMTPAELTQAIPPAYTEHIGRQLLKHLQAAA